MTSTNRAYRGAWTKGYDAAMAGEPAEACPYASSEQPKHGAATFSAAFARYWLDGHEKGLAAKRAAEGSRA